MQRLVVLICLLWAFYLPAQEENGSFHPIATLFRSVAEGIEEAADRVERASPQEIREKIIYWDSQLDQASRGLELLESYDPAVKPQTDQIQADIERLRRFAREENMERINVERQQLALHLRNLADYLKAEATRLENDQNGSGWSAWMQSVWEWFNAVYSEPEPSN